MFTAKVLVDGTCRFVGNYISRKSAEIAANVQQTMIAAEIANDGKTHTFETIVDDGSQNEHDLPPNGAMFAGQFVEFAPIAS